MKNFLVVDGAVNCAYDIFAVSDEVFRVIFPEDGQDIEFGEHLDSRFMCDIEAKKLAGDMYKNRIEKKEVKGIHGILFIGLVHQKSPFYPNKRDSDLDRFGR